MHVSPNTSEICRYVGKCIKRRSGSFAESRLPILQIGTERHRPSWLQVLTSEGTLADEYVHTHGRKVEEVMTCDPHTVSEDTPLEKVVRIMER